MLKSKLKVIIADDDEITKSYIKNLLSEINHVELVGEVGNGQELIEITKTLEPDVLLVDIGMPEVDGLNAVKYILDQGYEPYIIFLTGFDYFALNAFDLAALDYIVKPIRLSRLIKAFDKIAKLEEKAMYKFQGTKHLLTSRDKIFIKSGLSIILIDVDSIIMVEYKNKKSIIYCKDIKYETTETLKTLEKKLNFPQFFRSHTSFIVNIKYISQINSIGDRTYEIVFNQSFPSALISRANVAKVFSLLNIC